MKSNNFAIVIYGPTASGKTKLALEIAEICKEVVIINADSKQVYKDIPIITAQPDELERSIVSHRLYGHVESNINYCVSNWIDEVTLEIEKSISNNKIPILVGGTGMYIKNLIYGQSNIPAIPEEIKIKNQTLLNEIGCQSLYKILIDLDPLSRKLNQNDYIRVLRAYNVFTYTKKSIFWWHTQPPIISLSKVQFHNFFLNKPKDEIYNNCDVRFNNMIKQGVIDEIIKLKQQNLSPTLPIMKAHGVPEIISFLNNNITKEQAIEKAILNTKHYIKRQFTWSKNQMHFVLCSDTELINKVIWQINHSTLRFVENSQKK